MSVATSRPEYATLLAKTLPAVIHSEKENEHYTALLEELDHKPGKLTPAEERLAELLTLLIEDFEEKRYPLKTATAVETLEELMEANSLKQKLDRAVRCFADRAGWLPAYQRIEILRRLARLMEREFDALAMLIAREGGKPLIDAKVETTRAINGVEIAAGDKDPFYPAKITTAKLSPRFANMKLTSFA